MRKFALAAALILLSRNLPALMDTSSGSDRMMHKAAKMQSDYDREKLKAEIDETMVMVEDLARQLDAAPKAEIEEAWASGHRDFKLAKSEVRDIRTAAEDLRDALALEQSPKDDDKAAKALALRADARDQMRGHHKKQSEEYVRDLRNFINICEGTLRRANDARAAAVSGTAKPLSPAAKTK